MKKQTKMDIVHRVLLDTLIALGISVLFAWLLINFALGCGDVYHTADGRLIAGECAGMPWVEYQGGEEIPNDKD